MEHSVFLIIGDGDVIEQLQEQVRKMKLDSKVIFIPKMPFKQLYQYTVHADIGISIDKDTNINYRFSLPNKVFDYIQARVPVLATKLVEIRKIVEEYNIGMILESHEPAVIASTIKEMLIQDGQYEIWKENLSFAASELCWEKEEEKLTQIYSPFAG